MKAHHLEDTLRALKLFGMLDTLEVRLGQATAGQLGHIELIQALCEDEAARRDAHGLERRMRAARFEQVCAIEDFDWSPWALFGLRPAAPAPRGRQGRRRTLVL